ncbi:transcriptional repressor [Streptomyces cellulosae]
MRGSALANQRSTRQRRELLTLFQAGEDFASARSLHAAAEDKGIMVGLTTVYRTLRLLGADGGADVYYGRIQASWRRRQCR